MINWREKNAGQRTENGMLSGVCYLENGEIRGRSS